MFNNKKKNYTERSIQKHTAYGTDMALITALKEQN